MKAPAIEILDIVKAVIGGGCRELQRPYIGSVQNVIACAEREPTGYSWINWFEESLRNVTGADHAIAVSSGTAALHLALMAAGVKPGDEVIVPSLTFAATANAVCHAGAIPHFVDVNSATLGINPFKLRQYLAESTWRNDDGSYSNAKTGRRLAAIVPVHLLGLPCEVDRIQETANAYSIRMIEDAAEALGSRQESYRPCGTSGLAGILSFNNNKIVTTGGGGAVITNDYTIAANVRHLATTAKVRHDWLWQHDQVGWNYRMPNLCAALGLGQLERLAETIYDKRQLSSRYNAAFEGSKIAHTISINSANCWLNAIALDPHYPGIRDDVIRALQDEGYGARAIFTPLHLLPHFKDCPRQPDLRVSEDLFNRVVCLPSSIGGA